MLEEILTEYYQRIRTNSNGQDGNSSTALTTSVNQDFFIALPPSVRAEVLEFEADFRARQERSITAASGTVIAGAGRPSDDGTNNNNITAAAAATTVDAAAAVADMETTTFLATLPADLREDILLTSSDAVIKQLPPNVGKEARVLRERQIQSRLPWRVARRIDPYIASEARETGHGKSSSGGRNRTARTVPNKARAYKWKKVSHGWLREKPAAPSEPVACVKSDGIVALVRVLSVMSGSYDKNKVYQVLSHLCKTTEMRYVILDRLVSLIKSKPSDISVKRGLKDLKKENEQVLGAGPEFIRIHAAIVKRVLELLTML